MKANKLRNCEQMFLIVRAPEVGPVDARQIRRFLSVERPESEWDVHELDVHDGKVMDKCVALKLSRDDLTQRHGDAEEG